MVISDGSWLRPLSRAGNVAAFECRMERERREYEDTGDSTILSGVCGSGPLKVFCGIFFGNFGCSLYGISGRVGFLR